MADIYSEIEEMQNMAQMLTPQSFPQVSRWEEQDVDVLKQRMIWIDGYNVALRLSYSDFSFCRVENLEIMGVCVPFLPMYLVCKIGAMFLGRHDLRYDEGFKMGRRVYMWTICVADGGKPVPMRNPLLERCSYENFAFSSLSPEIDKLSS